MNVADVRAIVEAARVDPTYYSFEGDRHEALCLFAEGQAWKVHLSERGTRSEERSFGHEVRPASISSSAYSNSPELPELHARGTDAERGRASLRPELRGRLVPIARGTSDGVRGRR